MELCRVTTSDGLQLDGSFVVPDGSSLQNLALVLIHGTGGNFYSGGVLATVAENAAACSFTVLRINTRGHDFVANTPSKTGSMRIGAAYENVADAPLDISAWCDFLADRGQSRIVLIGHSLGGVKAILSQAMSPHPLVAGVVGVSPPRFCYQRLHADSRCDAFRRGFSIAGQLVAAGQGDTLMSVSQPLPMIITADGFLAKYGPDDALDYLPMLSQLASPQLILLAGQTLAANPAFDGLDKAVTEAQCNLPRAACETIPGADINFRNDPAEPWRRIEAWAQDL